MIYSILLLGFIFRIILSFFGTYWPDFNSFIAWSNRILEVGFKDFYSAWSDYLPGYMYVLYFLAVVKKFFLSLGIHFPKQLLYKLPSILADLGTSFLIYKIVKKYRKKIEAILASFVYLFNPVIWANSTLWGQADSFLTFFIFWAVYLFTSQNYLLSALILSFACVIKPLGFFILPLLIFSLIVRKQTKKLINFLSIFIIALFAFFIPFSKENLLIFIFERISATFEQYPYTSLNAFNFWGVLNLIFKSDKTKFLFLSLKTWGMVFFSFFYLLSLKRVLKKQNKAQERKEILKSSLIILYSSFLFLTRIHERHLLIIFPFLTVLVFLNPLLRLPYFLSSLVYLLNLRYAFVWLTDDFKSIFSPLLIRLFSLLQLFSFAGLIVFLNTKKKLKFRKLFSNLKNKKNRNFKKAFKIEDNRKNSQKRNYQRLLVILLIFSFFIRVLRLNYPHEYVFDEVYHGFTAELMAESDPKAWEWWNTPPEGFAYEWTHPPLSKLMMAGGTLIFGKDHFSYRLPAAIVGTASIAIAFLLAKAIFKDEKLALLTAFFLGFDGMIFAMSRIAMADIYFLFFLLLTVFCCWKEKYFWSAVALGGALACKWTGIYLYPLLALIVLNNFRKRFWKKKLKITEKSINYLLLQFFKYLFFPVLVYLISYLPFFTTGHNFDKFIELQKQMWWYHTRLDATHNYQSDAWSWPLLLRPVWFWVKYSGDKIGNIYNIGNPLFWWSGLVLLPFAIYQAVENILERKDFKLSLVLVGYFCCWFPWMFSPRIMFLYHYMPALPFLAIITAWFFRKIEGLNFKIDTFQIKGSSAVNFLLLMIVVLFFFFYPINSGIMISKELVDIFFWLPSWK